MGGELPPEGRTVKVSPAHPKFEKEEDDRLMAIRESQVRKKKILN